MENKNWGGKRLGSGRKGGGNPKKEYRIYLYETDSYKFGGEDKMKEFIYESVKKYGTEDVVNIIHDLNKPTNVIKPYEAPKTNYTINTMPKVEPIVLSEFEALKKEILKTETVAQIETVMRKVKSALMFPKEKMQLESIAKEHSKDFFTD